MGNWIVEGTECLDKMVTVMSQLVIDEVAPGDCFEPMLSVMSVLAGHCCEGDYCIMEPQWVAEWYQGNKSGAGLAILKTLEWHEWQDFDYIKAALIVKKLIEHNLVELRWIEWNGDKV